jgi:hypothetical protein
VDGQQSEFAMAATKGDLPGDATLAIERTASQAVDPAHLLDGEDPDTLQPHDADHWIRVYSELLAFKTSLLERARQLAEGTGDSAHREIASTDLTVMDAQARKLRHRLEFWRRRGRELEGRRPS